MDINRKLVTMGMAVTATVGTLVFAVPGGAQAAPSGTAQAAATCNGGALCMYDNQNFTGATASVSATAIPQANLGNWGMNDRIGSVCNYLGRTVWFYRDVNYNGGAVDVPDGACLRFTGPVNNDASSVHWQ
jgi:hypothetical protein